MDYRVAIDRLFATRMFGITPLFSPSGPACTGVAQRSPATGSCIGLHHKCKFLAEHQSDIDSADFPGIRYFAVAVAPRGEPDKAVSNGMIYPLAPFGIKGVIWYQGEHYELTTQGADSYYYKLKALVQGWSMLWGEEFPLCMVSWAARGAGSRCLQFNYGNAEGFGAATHLGNDLGWAARPPAAGAWHYLVLTYDGTTEKVYVDGVLNNSAAKSLDLTAGEPLFLGNAFNPDLSSACSFSGSLASVKVWDAALSPLQIFSDYLNPGSGNQPASVLKERGMP